AGSAHFGKTIAPARRASAAWRAGAAPLGSPGSDAMLHGRGSGCTTTGHPGGGQVGVDIAVINSAEELAELLEMVFQQEGFTTARGYTIDFKRGRQDLETFMTTQDPR